MKFDRHIPPVVYKNYSKYRDYTRADFLRFCAHCQLHENDAGGERAFEQDHFEPRHRKMVDPADYLNLYWSCRPCNSPSCKGQAWPSEEELARGEFFCDPCDHDPFGVDYTVTEAGTLDPMTPAGDYTIDVVRLNDRPNLVHQRQFRRHVRIWYLRLLGILRHEIGQLLRDQHIASTKASDRLSKLNQLAMEYEAYVRREPFVIDGVPPVIPHDLIALAKEPFDLP